jgi:hypothetical protein
MLHFDLSHKAEKQKYKQKSHEVLKIKYR